MQSVKNIPFSITLPSYALVHLPQNLYSFTFGCIHTTSIYIASKTLRMPFILACFDASLVGM